VSFSDSCSPDLTSLQQRLLKNRGRHVEHARYDWLLSAQSYKAKLLFEICSGGSPDRRFRLDSRGGGSWEIHCEQRCLTKPDGQASGSILGACVG